MTIIICVEDRLGFAFNGRRLSQDRLVSERILKEAKDGRLWCRMQSASLFQGLNDEVLILADNNFCSQIGPNDNCFVETLEDLGRLIHAERIILFRWNRRYPYTQAFSFPPGEWKLQEIEEFAGYSHERITKEIFEKQ